MESWTTGLSVETVIMEPFPTQVQLCKIKSSKSFGQQLSSGVCKGIPNGLKQSRPADLAKTPASKRVKGISGEVMETSSAAGLPKNQLDSLRQDISDLVVAGDHISTLFAGDCMVAKVIKYTGEQGTLRAL
eukprot:Em0007g1295a